jgi:hypothetical protein
MPTVYLRKNIKYRASTAVLCLAGNELGNTMHGHHDFQLADDVLHKVHIGHYTFYSKAIVKNAKYMIRAPGVFVREYVSGEGGDLVKLDADDDATMKDVMHLSEFVKGGDPDESQDLANRTLYSHNAYGQAGANNYYVRGTCYTKGAGGVTSRTISALGFGEHAYPGCKFAREGKGVALAGYDRTLASMI